jgi:hypothetical protein
VAERLTPRVKEAGWQVQDRANGAPGTRRFIERLGQFLTLIGLTSLIVAGIGVGNGVTSYLDSKRGTIATLKLLGATSRTIFYPISPDRIVAWPHRRRLGVGGARALDRTLAGSASGAAGLAL